MGWQLFSLLTHHLSTHGSMWSLPLERCTWRCCSLTGKLIYFVDIRIELTKNGSGMSSNTPVAMTLMRMSISVVQKSPCGCASFPAGFACSCICGVFLHQCWCPIGEIFPYIILLILTLSYLIQVDLKICDSLIFVTDMEFFDRNWLYPTLALYSTLLTLHTFHVWVQSFFSCIFGQAATKIPSRTRKKHQVFDVWYRVRMPLIGKVSKKKYAPSFLSVESLLLTTGYHPPENSKMFHHCRRLWLDRPILLARAWHLSCTWKRVRGQVFWWLWQKRIEDFEEWLRSSNW